MLCSARVERCPGNPDRRETSNPSHRSRGPLAAILALLPRRLQFELRRHDFSTFSENGLVVPGCPACKKRLNTLGQFMDHLADNIPGLINRLSEANQKIGSGPDR